MRRVSSPRRSPRSPMGFGECIRMHKNTKLVVPLLLVAVMVMSIFSVFAYAAAPPYSASFTETGLPAGAQYNVTLTNATKTVWSGLTAAGSTATITAKLYNGTYVLGASAVMGSGHKYSGLVWSPPTSTIIGVSGGTISGTTALTFYEEFLLNFTESGLPSGTLWSVLVNGNTYTSTKSYLNLNEANGSYSFSIFAVNGYSPSPTSGTVSVSGGNVSVPISYSSGQKQYAVSFVESGLPSGTSWSVNAGGTLTTSNTNTVSFSLSNGSYSFKVFASNSHFYPIPKSGYVTVSGKTLQQNITFNYGYLVNFTATHLAKFVSWSVTYNGSTNTSTLGYITFMIRNGSYQFSVSIASNWKASPVSGYLNVSGAAASEAINFTELFYKISFIESGLPSGSVFTLTINNLLYQSTNGTITLTEHNGTFAFTPATVSGYTVSPATGTISLGFSNVVQSITYTAVTVKSSTGQGGGFTLSQTSIIAFLHSVDFMYLVFGVIIVAIGATVYVLGKPKHTRKGSRPKRRFK